MYLITGANGFIGSSILSELHSMGHQNLFAATRKEMPALPKGVVNLIYDLRNSDDLFLNNKFDCVIHCAARVHKMKEKPNEGLEKYRNINVDGTLALARNAAKNGVKKFIYLSSIKVNGDNSNIPFDESTEPNPKDSYSISKLESERKLLEIGQSEKMSIIIIRPSLVYGKNVKGNLSSVIKAISIGVPLPIKGLTTNRRSFLYVKNLVDFLLTSLKYEGKVNEVFLLSDERSISTYKLFDLMASSLNKKKNFFNLPEPFLIFFGRFVRQERAISRLTNNLEVDINKAKKFYNWEPPFSIEKGMEDAFRASN